MDMSIPFDVLKQTTEGFSDKQMIGSGGYGNVYKGVYNDEEIAAKLFHNVFDRTPFEKEFFNIMRIQHPNVVRFVGYCYETHHKLIEYNGDLRFCQHISRILCFELMQGGSLDKYLKEPRDHDWTTCYDILKGTCEGLNFLHTGCGSPVLHLDLKPANILLDNNMGAKLADFGLSRFFSKTQTQTTNTIVGTEDYMPPEFMAKRQISTKNDVYSLGVIIIEVLAGRRGYLEFREMNNVTPFIGMVIMNWREWIYATTSPFQSAELYQVETCMRIAIKCVDPERNNRPTVAEILDNLKETEKRFHLLGQSLPIPTKSGPRGGTGGNICDIEEKPWRMTSLTIFCRGIIDAFSFSYIDQSWKKQHVGPWGADYIKKNNETIFFGPLEFVEEVYGSYGSYRGIIRVISLTFVTNVRSYGPFGNPYLKNLVAQTHFRFMADEGSSIVGFHGRSGSYIDAIGVYMCPNNRTTIGALSGPLILDGQSLPTPTKSGPRGGSGGGAQDIKEKPWRLANLTICHGGVINAFSFSYIDQSGKRQHEGPWGKEDSNRKTETICFGPLEFVEEVSGTYGSRLQYTLVISLTFVTNVRTYGPFGNPYYKDWALTHFRFMADKGSSIVGFHGRSGTRLDSIGVYMYPMNKTTEGDLSVPVTLEGQSLPTPTKSRTWGGSGGDGQDINEKPWRLTGLTVSYKGLIDAFSFSYIDQAGKKQSVGPWGQGYHWDITKTIRFGPSEFVKEVSGAYGIHHGNTIVKFLTFVTNVETYGPFGTPDHPGPDVSATHFRFMADEGSSIVGFYGRSGRYIDAIGVYTVCVT